MKSVRIDIISDVVCPWCFVGYKRIKQALSQLDDYQAKFHWYPFEVNPDLPDEGQDIYHYFSQKYGMNRESTDELGASLQGHGDQLNIQFNYPRNNRKLNSFKAHQLLAWARTLGQEEKLYEALFIAYFTDIKDISKSSALLEIAGSTGLNREAAEQVLITGQYATAVKTEEQIWLNKGVDVVPTIMIDQQSLIPGSQALDVYIGLIETGGRYLE